MEILSAGIARHHRGNPAASIIVKKLYGTPVLLSGIASLVLTKWEINIIDQHLKQTLRNLLKLYSDTPQAFIYFMAGSLPGEALLHQRQPWRTEDPLNIRATYASLGNFYSGW